MTFFCAMDPFFSYQSKREQLWPEVERFLGALPSSLLEQAILLQHHLATHHSETGQFKDILARPSDYPLLYWHFWLLDDLLEPQGPARDALERELFLGMLFSFAATYLHESILDESTFFGNDALFLALTLAQEAQLSFSRLFPADAPFWGYHRQWWQDHAEASLNAAQRRPHLEDGLPPARRLAPTKISVAAVALWLGQEARLPALLALVEHVNIIYQIIGEISTVRRDLLQGQDSYLIHRTLQEAGLVREPSLTPEQLLGALLLTRTVGKVCQECRVHLAQARQITEDLELPTVRGYLATLGTLLDEADALFSFGGAAKKPSRHFAVAPAMDPLAKAIEMAEGYLLADLTFRESWEVQRQGMVNHPVVTAQAFASGLILEVLCRYGHDLAEQVDELFRIQQENDFQCYDQPFALPDTDDLGLLLRLLPYSARQAEHRELLQTPLSWMEASLLPSGEIPVWFSPPEDPAATKKDKVLLWGNECAAVELNFLLGLMNYDWERYRPLIERAALALLQRLVERGLGTVAYYVPLASLWIAFDFLDKAAPRVTQGSLLADPLRRATEVLRQRLVVEAARTRPTPQEAAFLLLLTVPPERASLRHPGWLTILLKQQRYDGSWLPEPLYVCPNRGGASVWYSSSSVTTAFCYHALQQCTFRRPS